LVFNEYFLIEKMHGKYNAKFICKYSFAYAHKFHENLKKHTAFPPLIFMELINETPSTQPRVYYVTESFMI
jgi:hypothetical protein